MEGERNIVHHGLDDCPECYGEGSIPCDYCPDFGDHCSACGNTGELICADCGGSGREGGAVDHTDYSRRRAPDWLSFADRLEVQTEKLRRIINTPLKVLPHNAGSQRRRT